MRTAQTAPHRNRRPARTRHSRRPARRRATAPGFPETDPADDDPSFPSDMPGGSPRVWQSCRRATCRRPRHAESRARPPPRPARRRFLKPRRITRPRNQNHPCSRPPFRSEHRTVGLWRSLVARPSGGRKVAGSSPASPTNITAASPLRRHRTSAGTMKQGVLTDTEITGMIDSGQIAADQPFEPGQVQPASLDLRLGAQVATACAPPSSPGKDRTVADRLTRLHHAPDRPDRWRGPGKRLRLRRAPAGKPRPADRHPSGGHCQILHRAA